MLKYVETTGNQIDVNLHSNLGTPLIFFAPDKIWEINTELYFDVILGSVNNIWWKLIQEKFPMLGKSRTKILCSLLNDCKNTRKKLNLVSFW